MIRHTVFTTAHISSSSLALGAPGLPRWPRQTRSLTPSASGRSTRRTSRLSVHELASLPPQQWWVFAWPWRASQWWLRRLSSQSGYQRAGRGSWGSGEWFRVPTALREGRRSSHRSQGGEGKMGCVPSLWRFQRMLVTQLKSRPKTHLSVGMTKASVCHSLPVLLGERDKRITWQGLRKSQLKTVEKQVTLALLSLSHTHTHTRKRS